MNYLINTTENYRVNSESAAMEMIEQAKQNSQYTLSKYSCTYKEKKQKGEVIDYYWKVSLTKAFQEESEPAAVIEVEYKEDGGAF